MKRNTFMLACLLAFPMFLTAQTGKNFIDQPYIEVYGKAEKEVIPDMIYLQVIIDEKDNKAKVPLEDLEKKMLATLQKIGVDTKNDVAILDYASNFKFYMLKKTDILTTKNYQVLVHDGNTAAKVYFELEKLNISNISVLKTDHSKIEAFRQDVKIEAAKAARNKADKLCEAVGQKAGKAIYIQEFQQHVYRGNMAMMESNTMMKVSGGGLKVADELNIEFEKIKLEYEVMARFIIE